jgi:hypothetical protein
VRGAVGRLVRDSWVIGIATAIAIGYAGARLVVEIVDLVLAVMDGEPSSGRFVVEIDGHDVPYFEVMAAAVAFAAVALLGAWLLARAERE